MIIERHAVEVPTSVLISTGPSLNQRNRTHRKARQDEARRQDGDDHRAVMKAAEGYELSS